MPVSVIRCYLMIVKGGRLQAMCPRIASFKLVRTVYCALDLELIFYVQHDEPVHFVN